MRGAPMALLTLGANIANLPEVALAALLLPASLCLLVRHLPSRLDLTNGI
jgi:hypothetical protein